MKLIRRRKLDSLKPFQLICDNSILYFITISNKTMVSCYDVKKETVLNRFSIDTFPQLTSQCSIDEHSLYFPTKFGQVLSIDKNKGEIQRVIDVGWASILSNVMNDERNIYTVCGVPLSNGIKISTNQYCLVINDKNTGKKIGQSRFFNIDEIRVLLDKDIVWMSFGNVLYKCKTTGEVISDLNLTYVPSDNFITYNNIIVLFNNKGSITFLDKNDLSVISGLATSPSRSSPVIIGNFLYRFCSNNLIRINMDTYLKEEIMDIATPIETNIDIFQGNLIACNRDGDFMKYNIEENQMYKLPLQKEKMSTPVSVDGMAFICSDTSLYQVEL